MRPRVACDRAGTSTGSGPVSVRGQERRDSQITETSDSATTKWDVPAEALVRIFPRAGRHPRRWPEPASPAAPRDGAARAPLGSSHTPPTPKGIHDHATGRDGHGLV